MGSKVPMEVPPGTDDTLAGTLKYPGIRLLSLSSLWATFENTEWLLLENTEWISTHKEYAYNTNRCMYKQYIHVLIIDTGWEPWYLPTLRYLCTTSMLKLATSSRARLMIYNLFLLLTTVKITRWQQRSALKKEL